MRTIVGFIFIALSAAGSVGQVQVAHVKEPDIAPPSVRFVTATADLPDTLKNVISTDPVLPRRPNDLLRDYETEMEAISRRFANELGAISQAVQYGRISREQAEETSSERYQVAMMQFQLFSALHAILEHEIDQSSTRQLKSPSQDETAIVALPFSSLQLNRALVQYLQLTQAQAAAIEELMSNQRRELGPVIAEFQTARRRLLWLNRNQSEDRNDEEVHAVAASQASALSKLIVANSRLQTTIYQILNAEQRKKLDDVERGSEVFTSTEGQNR
jgi:Spy/CpxP family protein refolding chaperone